MSSLRSPITGLFLRVVVWLPLMFVAWYYMAIVLTWPVTWLTDQLIHHLFSEVIGSVRQSGYRIEVLTTLSPGAAVGAVVPKGVVPEITFSVNPLIYGYCLPLFSALVLSSPGSEGERWGRWFIGILLLYPVQAFGVSMEIVKTMLFRVGPQVGVELASAQWQYELTALGYQFGYLILPAVAPLVLWIALHQRFIATLAPSVAARITAR